MKILIGTPIHECKDYCMERWLKNVSKMEYPADLLLVDNSLGLTYVEQVKDYCKKYHLRKYRIIHLDLNQDPSALGIDIRIEKSAEVIRQQVLSGGYDAWFSWECDQLIPKDALDKLVKLMKSGNFMIVAHNSWYRNGAAGFNFDMGCTLISRECLEQYCLSPQTNSNKINRWQGKPEKYKDRVASYGGSSLEVTGLIDPIYHL